MLKATRCESEIVFGSNLSGKKIITKIKDSDETKQFLAERNSVTRFSTNFIA